jgi:hypothetical protein
MKLPLLLSLYLFCSFCLNHCFTVFAFQLSDNKLHVSVLHVKKRSGHNNFHDEASKGLSATEMHGDISVKATKKVVGQVKSKKSKVAIVTQVKSLNVKSKKTEEKHFHSNVIDKHKTSNEHESHVSVQSTPKFKVNAKLFVRSSDLEKFTSVKNSKKNSDVSPLKGDTMDKSGKTYLCPSGHFSAAGGGCEPCLAGTFSEAGSTKCSLCGKGTFADSVGQASCTPCPSGLFNPREGGRDAEVCQKCPPGFSCESEQLGSPKPCSDGKYSPLGTAACKSCPTFFSPDTVQSSCKAKTSFYVATSSLSFAFFGLIGIMAGRIKKASNSLNYNSDISDVDGNDGDEIISFEGIYGYTIDQDDFECAVNRATTSVDYGII